MTSSDLPRTAVPVGITDPVLSARAELKAALAAIEIKGNFPRRIDNAAKRAAVKVRRTADRNPGLVAVGAIAIAGVAGSLVWVVARALSR